MHMQYLCIQCKMITGKVVQFWARTGRFLTPRSRSSKWCLYLLLTILLVSVVSYKSGHLHYFLASQVLKRRHYTMQELSDMIPYENIAKVGEHNPLELLKRAVHNSSVCKQLDPKAVFVIRIAKCASTSLVQLLKAESKHSLYELFFHPSGAFDWDVRTMKQVAHMAMAKRKRFVYARHFYYVDFRPFNLDSFTYVTFVRDPVSRFVSSFLYYHYSSKAHIQSILNPAHKNETLLHCLEHQHEGCVHNLMTKYFCGHYPFCKLGNKQALSRAKDNIKRDFAVVGLVEEMDLSLKVLAKTVPKYFGLLGSKEVDMINRNEHKRILTEFEEKKLRESNSADIQLYQYVKDSLHAKAVSCGL